ncbi:hypothetical protein L602_000800000260 [Cupriavidus gilardii J11]|uniref:Uncharacterized protein n=1 Tax=Cupriavidus gilardii J11 TaxID=936133 RepID=A0A562B164_9BURK|nr:hypothetical protein L602_000800000260 [Cupriavidus gilardii J11]
MHETLKTFLMSEPTLSGKRFMIEVKDAIVSISHLPQELPGSARVCRYTFTLNEKGDNIAGEAERIKAEILTDCLVPGETPEPELKSQIEPAA